MTPLIDRIAAVEARALRAYAKAGLPVRPGHYRKGPRARSWTFLGAEITPAERWDLALERPEGKGWRFGTLATLGRYHPTAAVATASRHLIACADLRNRLASGAVGGAEAEALIAALKG